MHDRRLDAFEVTRHRRPLDVFEFEASHFAGPGINLGEKGDEPAIAQLGMGMPEFESAPFRMTQLGPATFAAAHLQDFGPADPFLPMAERLGHTFPHADHDRREHQALGAAHQVPAGRRPRTGIAELDESRRGRADEVGLAPAFKNFVDGLARTHGHRFHPYPFTGAQPGPFGVQLGGQRFDPLLLLRTVGEKQTDLRHRGLLGLLGLRVFCLRFGPRTAAEGQQE